MTQAPSTTHFASKRKRAAPDSAIASTLPLTLALSPRRGNMKTLPFPRRGNMKTLPFPRKGNMKTLPLPSGEGWGEGRAIHACASCDGGGAHGRGHGRRGGGDGGGDRHRGRASGSEFPRLD